MRRTERTPIDDNTVDGNLDKSDVQVIYAQFHSITACPSRLLHFPFISCFQRQDGFQIPDIGL